MGKPLWRKAFDEVDQRVSGPVEAGAHSDLFSDLVTLQWKLARRASARSSAARAASCTP